jgi:hypothetical protein
VVPASVNTASAVDEFANRRPTAASEAYSGVSFAEQTTKGDSVLVRRQLMTMIAMIDDGAILEVGRLLQSQMRNFEVTFPGILPQLQSVAFAKGPGLAASATSQADGTSVMSDLYADFSDADSCVAALSHVAELPLTSAENNLVVQRTITATRDLLKSSESHHRNFGLLGGCDVVASVLRKLRSTSTALWEDVFETVEAACAFGDKSRRGQQITAFCDPSVKSGNICMSVSSYSLPGP